MKSAVQRIVSHPSYEKAVLWGKLITITASAQVIIQAISFGCGILVVRLLPTHEYALYILANTMIGAMVVITDGGISTGVMAQGGKVWQSQSKLGVVLATGLDLRKKFAIISLIVAVPVLLVLLRQHGASWVMAILLLIAIVPSFFTSLSSALLEVAPKLRQDISPLQKNQIGVNVGRLLLLVLTLFWLPWSFIAILAAGLPQLWGNWRLRKISAPYADLNQLPNSTIRTAILAIVKRVLPGAIFYSTSGQITIWLASIFGSTDSVAQVGALGRLSQALGIFSVLINTLVIPRFARQLTDRRLLLKRYFLIQFGLVIVSFCLISAALLFPNQALWILGKNYAGLHVELALSIAGGCLNLITGVSFALVSSRGWATNPAITIFIEVISIIIGLLMIDVSTLKGVLILNIFIASSQVLLYVSYGALRIINNKS